ncbi:hypothetical protein [Pseudomonas synxantha]|uniref:hypothetical protein n=1 Tax=Pseudomonas synxantha TaxID=47883 RepID=UPI0013DD9EA3|nr:hypothetical protein [Pseudomonas synxantha]
MKSLLNMFMGDYKPDLPGADDRMWEGAGVVETTAGFQQFAVILVALLWSQYEFVADR